MNYTSDEDERSRAEAALRWGKTPRPSPIESDPGKMPPDHPVHNISPEKLGKMRQKGVNPVFWVEQNAAVHSNGKEKSFWSKYGMSALGNWRK